MTDIISAIENLFIIRNDSFPRQRNGLNEYGVVKDFLTKQDIVNHLRGKHTIGTWQIDPKTNKVKWICFDFDGDLKEELSKAKKLYNKFKKIGYNPLLEFSGRRGYHVWLFVEPVDAKIARDFAVEVSKDIKPHEVFPKKEKIKKDGFGAQVKLPLGLHRVSMKRSYFFDENFKPISLNESKKFLIELSGRKRDVIKVESLEKFIS